MDQHRSLLFGMMAVRLNKLCAEDLATIAAQWVDEPARDLPDRLVDEGLLTRQDQETLHNMVDAAVRSCGNDAEKTLDALGGASQVYESFNHTIGFDEVSATVVLQPMAQVGEGSEKGSEDLPVVHEHSGRYRFVRDFASGGVGRILLVHDEHIGRDVALKELLPQRVEGLNTQPGTPTVDLLTVPIIARFLQEARVTGQLEHPSIIPVYEVGHREDGSLYYTMRLVKGRTLHDTLKECTSLADRLRLLPHFLDLCQAMAYAHSRGVIHRDLKPLNVMVGEFGETVVIDWGLAKAHGKQDIYARDMAQNVQQWQNAERLVDTGSGSTGTMYGQAMGSPYFMPPEQAQGQIDAIDERSDIYALGAILYTFLGGQLPFFGMGVKEFLSKVATFDPKPVRELEPDAPPELVAICERAMAKKPEDRYPTARELADDVQRFISGKLVSAYAYRLSDLVKRYVRRHWKFLATLSACLLALIAIGTYSYVRVVREKRIAVLEREKAERATNAALLARQHEERAKEEAQRELYHANIALAERSIGELRMGPARDLLLAAPMAYRHWEWGHLMYLANADIMTFVSRSKLVGFTPKGEVLAGSVVGTVSVFDPANPDTPRVIADKSGFNTILDVDARAEHVLVVTDDALTIVDVASGTPLTTVGLPADSAKKAAAISADGSRAAVVLDNGSVLIATVGGNEVTAQFKLDRSPRYSLAFRDDGRFLAVGANVFGESGFEGSFEVRDAESGALLHKASLPPPLFPHAIQFSPSGHRLAVGTDQSVLLWDVEQWVEVGEIPGRVYYADSVAFSPNGRFVAVGDTHGRVRVCSTETGAEIFTGSEHLDTVYQAVFSPDSRYLATASSDRTAIIWDMAEHRRYKTLRGHAQDVFCAAFSPDGRRAATGSYDGTTKLWDLGADLEHAAPEAMAVTRDGKMLAGAEGRRISLWDSRTGRQIASRDVSQDRVRLLAFVPGQEKLACVAFDHDRQADVLSLWNFGNPEADSAPASPALEGMTVDSMSYSPDGALLALKAGTRLVLVSDQATSPEVRESVHRYRFSPDGRWLAVGDQHGSVLLLSLPGLDVAHTFEAPTTSAELALAFSPDGSSFAVGRCVRNADGIYESRINLWAWPTGGAPPRIQADFTLLDAIVRRIAFDTLGERLAAAGKTSAVTLWNLQTREVAATLSGHSGEVKDLGFSPDGQRLVTAGADGTFKIWDCVHGRELLTVQDAALDTSSQPYRASFSADGGMVLTVTAPQVTQPVVLHSFPWRASAYPGAPNEVGLSEMEAFKREYWEKILDE